MKVLLHYDAGPAWRGEVESLTGKGLQVDCCAEADDARFHALLPEAEVIWHVLRPLGADDVSKASKLRLIQKIGVGVNTIDLAAAKARGVAVCNMPGTNARAVAETTLLLMLACLRRLPLLDRATRAGEGWRLPAALQDHYGELYGKVVGLVGYGAIPQTLTPILQAFGAKVVYTASAPKPHVPLQYLSLPQLLEASDIVSLHVPLTPETAGLLGRETLSRMRRGALLINTARGGLVDHAALAEMLAEGRLGGAGLDVFDKEPLPADHPLLTLDNVVLMPHVAWLSKGTLTRSLQVAVENCRRLTAGEDLLHRVA